MASLVLQVSAGTALSTETSANWCLRAGLWDNVPIIGRLTRFFHPPSDESDMSANRAKQVHMFDHLWAENDFKAKRDLLQKQDQLFTCGYDIATPDGLKMAANASHCCNVNLTKPDRDNHGYVQVWSESKSCRWTLLEVFKTEYAPVRVELAAVVMTMLACRLLGEVLSWISIWDSALTRWFKLGKVLCALWYGTMLALLCYVLNSNDETNRENLDHIKEAAHTEGYVDIPAQATLFEVLAALALVPELLCGSNSVLSAVAKLALACCPQKGRKAARECRRSATAMCQPGYVRKITGRMSSATCSWIKYSIIWVLLIWCKCYFSYVFEIRLAVKNEATTWRAIATPFRRSESAQAGHDAPFWDEFLLKHVQSRDGGVVVAEVVLLLTWIPIFLVFVMDSQIAFSVCQMIVGVWTGLNLRVGHVNSWADFEHRLARKLIRKFRINLDATSRQIGAPNAPGGARMSIVNDRIGSFRNQAPGSRVPNQGMRGTLLYGASVRSDQGGDTMIPGASPDDTSAFEFKRNAPSFRRFAECWNLFIHKLRYDDYLSDHEASLYNCMVVDSLGAPWLPPLLALDGIANLLDRIDDLEDAHKALFHGRVGARGRADQDLWEKDTRDFLNELHANANQSEIREALICVQTLTLFLLKRVTGADSAQQPFERGSGILLWFNQLRFTSYKDPILRKLLPDPTGKSAKGARDNLVDTIARFADTVANFMCSVEDGPSKQRGQSFDRAADRNSLEIEKIASTTKNVLVQIQRLCEGVQNEDLKQGTIDTVLQCPLFQDDRDKGEVKRIHRVAEDREVQRAATYLQQILKVRRVDAMPTNAEALRRILTFASSLHMKMPKPRTVATCKSLTSFTPFYAEDVLYTREQIMEEKGQASMCSYLQTVHPDEWQNLVERLGIAKEAAEAGGTIPDWVWSDEVMATEVRLWASLRGQTLARTIHGVMQVEEGLKLFARQEEFQNHTLGANMAGDRGKLWQADSLWKRYAHMKFQYVISCQIYGNWSDGEDKKKSVDTLLRLFPHLRIAYVKQEPDKNGENKWFSFLVRWCDVEKKVVKCYRIEQAADQGGNGNWGPTWLVGEGKPENQNHAIVFTRGQYLQTLDMNQDGYFEEGLKMRNLLEEFTTDLGDEGVESKHDHQVRIIGFPEHQFSDTLSAVAEFSALTEFTFATLIQRSLASPFDVRMHYGHPDLFDRVFHVTRGGISKPMKFLCVSEDIFGAFNSVLKGGRVIYREYIKQGKGKGKSAGRYVTAVASVCTQCNSSPLRWLARLAQTWGSTPARCLSRRYQGATENRH
eukprot:COSAG02_NODE_2272_length_9263_cov_212.913902_4_plen_1294_part_00